jgi:hypothetical protein
MPNILLLSQLDTNNYVKKVTMVIPNYYYTQIQDSMGTFKDTVFDFIYTFEELIYDSVYRPYLVDTIREYKEYGQYLYLIDITDTTGKFAYTIISFPNKKRKVKNKKINIGQQYNFLLRATDDDRVLRQAYDSTVELNIEGIYIFLHEEIRKYKIVTTPNLRGLYYISSE